MDLPIELEHLIETTILESKQKKRLLELLKNNRANFKLELLCLVSKRNKLDVDVIYQLIDCNWDKLMDNLSDDNYLDSIEKDIQADELEYYPFEFKEGVSLNAYRLYLISLAKKSPYLQEDILEAIDKIDFNCHQNTFSKKNSDNLEQLQKLLSRSRNK